MWFRHKECTVTTGTRSKGRKDPNRQKSGFIQAPELLNKEIRRASEQTSPQVARAAGLSPKGQRAAD